MKYAWSPEIKGSFESWSLAPWRRLGLEVYHYLQEIPEDRILLVSHFAPWWEPLRSWIAAGRPWIEIEYGYWGPDTKWRETRRVTYRGHHNLTMKLPPWTRAQEFPEPAQRPWRDSGGDFVLIVMPVAEILTQRTGEHIAEWQARMEHEVRKYWTGPIAWREKTGSRRTRFAHFAQQIQNAYAVVGERTMAATEACLLGVPGFTVDPTMSSLLMGSIENLAASLRPDRTAWWEHVCWSQFHVREFQTDAPARLTELYQIG